MFKLVQENRGDDWEEQLHLFQAEELFQKLFSGANNHNQQVFRGKTYPLTLDARIYVYSTDSNAHGTRHQFIDWSYSTLNL